MGGALTVGVSREPDRRRAAARCSRTAAQAGRLNVINWGPAPGAPDFWRRVLTDPNIFWLADPERVRGLDGRLRHRPRPDAASAHRGDAAGEPAHAVAHAHRHARHAAHLSRHRRRALHVLRPASRAAAASRPTRSFRSSSARPCRSSCAASCSPPSCSPPSTRRSARSPPPSSPTSTGRCSSRAERAPLSAGVARRRGRLRRRSWPLLAWGFSFFDRFLWLAFKIAGVTFGSLLGRLPARTRHARARQPGQRGGDGRRWRLVNLVLLVLAEMRRDRPRLVLARHHGHRRGPCCSPGSWRPLLDRRRPVARGAYRPRAVDIGLGEPRAVIADDARVRLRAGLISLVVSVVLLGAKYTGLSADGLDGHPVRRARVHRQRGRRGVRRWAASSSRGAPPIATIPTATARSSSSRRRSRAG